METKKKLPTGAIAFAAMAVFMCMRSLISEIIALCCYQVILYDFVGEVGEFDAIKLFMVFAFVALAAFIIMQKDGLYIAIPLAAIALFNLIFFFKSFSIYECYFDLASYRSDSFVYDAIAVVISSFMAISITAVFAILALYIVTDKFEISVLKEKSPLLDKCYNVASMGFTVSAALYALVRFVTLIANMIDYIEDIDEPRILQAFFTCILAITTCIIAVIGINSLKNAIRPKQSKEFDFVHTETNAENFVSLGKHICLLLFTFGIWQLIWIYKSTKFSNYVKDESERGPGAALLLYIFIPFYSYYWTYQTAKRIDKIAKDRGVQSDIATMCLVLALFIPILPPIFMQDKINQAIVGNTVATANPEATKIDSIVKYKELLDQGIITEDEFEAKKKELLGL